MISQNLPDIGNIPFDFESDFSFFRFAMKFVIHLFILVSLGIAFNSTYGNFYGIPLGFTNTIVTSSLMVWKAILFVIDWNNCYTPEKMIYRIEEDRKCITQ